MSKTLPLLSVGPAQTALEMPIWSSGKRMTGSIFAKTPCSRPCRRMEAHTVRHSDGAKAMLRLMSVMGVVVVDDDDDDDDDDRH